MDNDIPAKLDERPEAVERRMVEMARLVHAGFSPLQAAKKLGYKKDKLDRSTTKMQEHPAYKKEMTRLRMSSAAKTRMTREKVQDIVLEAIQMGRLIGDPMSMIRGAQELNKMCGYYAAEKKEITLNDSQRRLVDKFDNMTDEELLAAVGDDSNVIEGEFEHMPNPSAPPELQELPPVSPDAEELMDDIVEGEIPRPDHALG